MVTRLRIALDATPLLGNPTGIGVFCYGALAALAERSDLALQGYTVSWRGRGRIDPLLPKNVRVAAAADAGPPPQFSLAVQQDPAD